VSFVQLVSAVALLVIGLGGAYNGISALVRGRVEYPPTVFRGRSAYLLAVLYLAGGGAALLVLLLMLLGRS
jgi:hypothetical protein